MADHPLDEAKQLHQAIAAQEGLRGVVPDEIVDAAIVAMQQRLQGLGSDAQRRRQVTVLFADVSGFTSMSARLDAEVVAGLMNEIWSRLDAVILAHGGRVDKHIGDAVMAVWGATSTEENDPERAVRAGLAMQEELALSGSGGGLAMRIGINTGPVHLGAVGAGVEFTAMGDTVNVASRVEGLAPRGGVLVTHDTYRHIRGVFDVEPLDPARVKGRTDPIRVYVVRRAKARSFRMATRGVEGVETGMVGRTRELEALQGEFETVSGQAGVRRVTVIGDAGVGKSRLLYEFENWIELHPASAYFFKGRALATRQSVPFGLMRDLLAERFGISDNDASSSVAAKLRDGLAQLLTDDEADLVGHWLGFDLRASSAVQRLLGSGQLATAARAHLLRAIEALAAEGPVVMFFEDMHWADDESLGFIDELVAHSNSRHLLVVGVGRPSLLERSVADGLLDRSSVALRLAPLEARASRMLVLEVMQKCESIPDAIIDLIVERAEGNAYYIEELVKMLIEDSVIETGDAWQVRADQLDPDRVPATLTGVLQTRLDSLELHERRALQRSSVVGRVFWDGTVAALGDEPVATTAASLDVARDRELIIRRERSSFDENVEYTFKHALLRDVTYETVLLRDRQRLHALVADWITDHAGERAGEYAGLIATHHRLAGNLEGAAALLALSGGAALESGNAAAARRSLDEAFELWAAAGQTPTVQSLTAMADACVRLGHIDAADLHIRQALNAQATADERVHALRVGTYVASERGERTRERALLDEALPIAEQLGGLTLARVLCSSSWFDVGRGQLDAATIAAARARDLGQELRHPAMLRESLSLLAAIAVQSGFVEQSLEHSREALVVAVSAGDLESQSIVLGNLGVGHHLLGDERNDDAEFHAAFDHYRQAKVIHERLGRQLHAALSAANMGQVQVRLGNNQMAIDLIHEAIVGIRRAGGRSSLLFCVLAEADRRLTQEDTSALELIGVVQRHPACRKDDLDEVARILAQTGLSEAEIERGLQRGAALAFDDVVEQIVNDLAAATDNV